MSQNLQLNRVSVCHKENYIHANGQNAKIISLAAAIMLLLMGIAALSRANN